MILPGIKLGPKQWRENLERSKAAFAEIWYRVDKPEWYPDLFEELHRQSVAFGLHFWAATASGHEPNVAYPGDNLRESITLIKQCIDTAHEQDAVYVNIHSGNRALMRIDFDSENLVQDKDWPVIAAAEAVKTRSQALTELGRYAHDHRLALLVEPVGAKVTNGSWHDPNARLHPREYYTVNLDGLLDLCQQGQIGFTNDFCHLFSMAYDQPRTDLYQRFMHLTRQFAPYTKLVHVNTLYEPYSGTDAHGGILPKDYQMPGVFPTGRELSELLSLIQHLSALVWAIGEPLDHHVENYQSLKKLSLRLSAHL